MLNRLANVLSLLVLLSIKAPAQPRFTDPDSHSPDRAQVAFSKDAARKFVDDFARCVASRQPGRAAAVLNLPYGSEQQAKAVGDLAAREYDCLGPFSGNLEIGFGAEPIASGMAEYFLGNLGKIAELRRRDPRSFAYREPIGIEAFGECVVAQKPDAVEALANSKIASPAESVATDALAPELQQCVWAGQTVALDRTSLRQVLTVSLYRHVAMPGDPRLTATQTSSPR